jgi:hypothetical protein
MSYLEALRLFIDWLEGNDQPTAIRAIQRERHLRIGR